MIKLVDVPNMEYFSSHGRGEVCIRGANVFQVYVNTSIVPINCNFLNLRNRVISKMTQEQ